MKEFCFKTVVCLSLSRVDGNAYRLDYDFGRDGVKDLGKKFRKLRLIYKMKVLLNFFIVKILYLVLLLRENLYPLSYLEQMINMINLLQQPDLCTSILVLIENMQNL